MIKIKKNLVSTNFRTGKESFHYHCQHLQYEVHDYNLVSPTRTVVSLQGLRRIAFSHSEDPKIREERVNKMQTIYWTHVCFAVYNH